MFRKLAGLTALAIVALWCTGCQENVSSAPPAPAPTTPSPFSQSQVAPPSSDSGGAASSSTGSAPLTGSGATSTAKPTMAQALALAPQEDTSVKPYFNKYEAARLALNANKTSAATQKAYIKAALSYAHYLEYTSSLDPVLRYRASLLLYEKVLAIDKNNTTAQHEYNQIASIYRTMGGLPH